MDEKRTTENAYMVPGIGFLEIHQTDGGWDWTFSDTALQDVDGGVVDVDCGFEEALSIATALAGIEGEMAEASVVDYDEFVERRDSILAEAFPR